MNQHPHYPPESGFFRHTRQLGRVFLVHLLVAAVAGIFVWQNVRVTEMRAEIRRLNRQSKKLLRKNDELKIAVAENSSAERLERIYRVKYGYIPVATRFRIQTLTLPFPPDYKGLRGKVAGVQTQKAALAGSVFSWSGQDKKRARGKSKKKKTP